MKPIETIGFIGAGGMGRPMADRLVREGYKVIVCDRHRSVLELFEAQQVRTTEQAAECGTADLVIVMVTNDDQVLEATLGAGGLIEGIDADRPPRLAIMSSVLPRTVQRVAAALEKKNVATVDAPVSGGGVSAAEGTLSIMVGGTPQDLDVLVPVLMKLGSRIFHCGPLGSGEAVKIVNNSVAITTTFLMTEVAQIAIALGLDIGRVAEVMDASSGRNSATHNYEARKAFYRLNTRDEQTLRSVLDLCRKDLILAQSLAKEADVATPMLKMAAGAADALRCEDIMASWKSLGQSGDS